MPLELQLAEQQKRPKKIREQIAETKTNKANFELKKAKLALPKKNKKEQKAINNLEDSQASVMDMTHIGVRAGKKCHTTQYSSTKTGIKIFTVATQTNIESY